VNTAQLAAAGTNASSGLGIGPDIGIGLGLVLIGIAIGASVMRARIGKSAAGPVGDQAASQPWPRADRSHDGEEGRCVDDSALVRTLIELDERARGAAWQPLVTAAMSACGIVADYPLSEAFDASRHRAVDTDTTTDPAADMRICEVERPGYLRWGASISSADVIVLRYQPDHSTGAGR
jgi:hypothetical protein